VPAEYRVAKQNFVELRAAGRLHKSRK
jgi:hypothetical protein